MPSAWPIPGAGIWCPSSPRRRPTPRLGLGMAVVRQGTVVAGASTYARYRAGIEIEVDTRPDCRRQGPGCRGLGRPDPPLPGPGPLPPLGRPHHALPGPGGEAGVPAGAGVWGRIVSEPCRYNIHNHKKNHRPAAGGFFAAWDHSPSFCSPIQVRRLRARASCFSVMGRSSSATSRQPWSGWRAVPTRELVRGGFQGDGQAHDDFCGGDGDGAFDAGEILISNIGPLLHLRLRKAPAAFFAVRFVFQWLDNPVS